MLRGLTSLKAEECAKVAYTGLKTRERALECMNMLMSVGYKRCSIYENFSDGLWVVTGWMPLRFQEA